MIDHVVSVDTAYPGKDRATIWKVIQDITAAAGAELPTHIIIGSTVLARLIRGPRRQNSPERKTMLDARRARQRGRIAA